MNTFAYFQPTDIRFGRGMINAVGKIVSSYGKRCLLVSRPAGNFLGPLFDRTKASLKEAGVDYAHFDGVIPNPTTDCVTAGANIAKEFHADVVLGVGGGSSMDAAKAIAVEATHPGTACDYLF